MTIHPGLVISYIMAIAFMIIAIIMIIAFVSDILDKGYKSGALWILISVSAICAIAYVLAIYNPLGLK